MVVHNGFRKETWWNFELQKLGTPMAVPGSKLEVLHRHGSSGSRKYAGNPCQDLSKSHGKAPPPGLKENHHVVAVLSAPSGLAVTDPQLAV